MYANIMKNINSDLDEKLRTLVIIGLFKMHLMCKSID